MGEADEFAISNDSYSRDDFYIAANDKRGHHAMARMAILPNLKGEIAALIASRVIPAYRTEQDFWRDAAAHRIHDLQEMLRDLSPALAQQFELMRRGLELEAKLERHRWQFEMQEALIEHVQYLLARPTAKMQIATDIREAILQIEDVNTKRQLSYELERYEARISS